MNGDPLPHQPAGPKATTKRVLSFIGLALAAGTAYTLPYIRQSYHNTMIDALALTEAQLRNLSAAYGITAMVCYLPSGWLADRFPARRLLAASLWTTGALGLWMAQNPGYLALLAIHMLWGVCTILTFWCALVKAMRDWGTLGNQGRSFGAFESGRGLTEAMLAAIGVYLFSRFGGQGDAFSVVVQLYAGMAIVVGFLVWFWVDDRRGTAVAALPTHRSVSLLAQLKRAAVLPTTWLLSLIVLAAYAGSWGAFDIGTYAEDGFGRSAEEGAALSTFRMWFRAIAPFMAGILADRIRVSRAVGTSFVAMAVCFFVFAAMPRDSAWMTFFWVNTGLLSLIVFMQKGICYALLQEGRVPATLTGMVVGWVSLIGYTPDIWSPVLLAGLFDALPRVQAHQAYFVILGALCVVGCLSAVAVGRFERAAKAANQGPQTAKQAAA